MGVFKQNGFDVHLVGGVVRDLVAGNDPKDIDLATNATPDQVVDMFAKLDEFSTVNTGIEHGTVTVVADDDAFEVTTFRLDVSTDGRRATVAFTDDWKKDAARRDFTFNAMFADADGMLFDLFGGQEDLANGRVRFVGDAKDRVEEDFLRVLRFFRFAGRFDSPPKMDDNVRQVFVDSVDGLKNVSSERVWAEVQKMLAGKFADKVFKMMADVGVLQAVGGDQMDVARLDMSFNDSRLRLASMMNVKSFDKLVDDWKLSNADRDFVKFVLDGDFDMVKVKKLLLKGKVSKDKAVAKAAFSKDQAAVAELKSFNPSAFVFPVDGNDLVAKGMKPGKELGQMKEALFNKWFDSDFKLSKDDLLA